MTTTRRSPEEEARYVVRSYLRDDWQNVPDALRHAVAYNASVTAEQAATAFAELVAAGRVETRTPGPLLAPPQARIAQTPQRVAARAAAKEWNGQHQHQRRRTVVVTVAGVDPEDESSVDVVYGEAYVNHDDVAAIRSYSHRDLRLDRITVHTLNAVLATAEAPEPEPLDFPPPDCGRCGVTLGHDGDGWTCRYCLARWDSNGSEGQYPCVECQDNDATVTGDDGQPRCTLCEARVRAGLLDPTPSYRCRRCNKEVHGIGYEFNSPCRLQIDRRCPTCQAAADRDAYLDEILGRRRRRATATATITGGVL